MANNFDRFLGAEDWEHINIIRYLREKHDGKIFFHIGNEGLRTPFERYKFSLFGKIKGLPDIAIIHPKFSQLKEDSSGEKYRQLMYMGLFLEIKAPERTRVVMKGKDAGKVKKAKAGTATPEQLDVIKKLNALKYKAVVCVGYDEAIKVIDDYFRQD
jgi:hypothetical protein